MPPENISGCYIAYATNVLKPNNHTDRMDGNTPIKLVSRSAVSPQTHTHAPDRRQPRMTPQMRVTDEQCAMR
ncbi:hypothetical protein D3C81_933860 [compost metagenome]